MSETKKVVYQVIADGTVEWETDNLDKAEGYAQALKDQGSSDVKVSRVILI